MVICLGSHEVSSFVPAGVIAHTEFDPTKSTTSSSDGNYAVSSDISDNRYVCDTPLSSTAGADGCSCSVGGAGSVTSQGRVFPGSMLGAPGTQTATMGPLGLRGGVTGVPHPSFRFAQPVTDVSLKMTDITIPGQEKVVWDANFRLTQPDGSLGGKYLPSSQAPIGGEMQNFHKVCAPLNSWHVYKMKILAGGQAPIDQTMVLKTYLVKPDSLMDPVKGAQGAMGDSAKANTGVVSMKATGPRFSEAQASPPASDAVPAVASSFSAVQKLSQDGTVLIRPDQRHFPSVTSTSFGGCNRALKLKNPEGCHKPPTVTIHSPNQYMKFL